MTTSLGSAFYAHINNSKNFVNAPMLEFGKIGEVEKIVKIEEVKAFKIDRFLLGNMYPSILPPHHYLVGEMDGKIWGLYNAKHLMEFKKHDEKKRSWKILVLTEEQFKEYSNYSSL